MEKKEHNFKNIVIINTGALGDNLLSTPLIEALYTQNPGCFLSLVTSRPGYDALKTNPCIKDFFIIDYDKSSFADKIKLGADLKALNPELAVNLTEKIWGYIWAFLSGAPVRAGFIPGMSQPVKSMLVSPLINRKVYFHNDLNEKSTMHEVERHFLILKALGIEKEPGKLKISILGNFKHDFKGASVVHLTRKWFSSGWDEEDFIDLIKHVSQVLSNTPVIVSYGTLEKDWAGDIIKRVEYINGVKAYYIGDIIEFAGILKDAGVVISPDTGIIHLASASGAPVVDIFEEKYFEHNSNRWYPWKTKYILIKREEKKEDKNKEEFFEDIVDSMRELQCLLV
ncbi:MAG: glycosyltransferase family 9 protein [Armatimonadota bacterium]